jgi:hypothetical protein
MPRAVDPAIGRPPKAETGSPKGTEPRPKGENHGEGAAPSSNSANFKDAFLGKIRAEKRFFYNTVVAQAQRIDISDQAVRFSFAPVHKTLREQLDKERPWLETVAEALAGHKVAVTGSETPGNAGEQTSRPTEQSDEEQRRAALRARAMENEGVQALLDVFSAEITKIEEM